MELRDDDRIKRLIIRYVKGVIDEREAKELMTWVEESVEHEKLFQRVVDMDHLENGIRRFVKTKAGEEKAWRQLLNRTIRKDRRARRIGWMQYVALFALPLGLIAAFFLMEKSEKRNDSVLVSQIVPGDPKAVLILPDGQEITLEHPGAGQTSVFLSGGVQNNGDTLNYEGLGGKLMDDSIGIYHTLRVPRGGEYTLVLADGSTVYLNAGSELRYPVGVNGTTRTVYLRGEAYFDVKHDERLPFLVEVEGLEIRVLGTSFGVRAYREEQNILTTLVQGRVDVWADGKQVKLVSGEQAGFSKVSKQLTTAKVEVEQFIGWKNGRLIFDNQPLEIILADLGRWYSFDVIYAGEALKQIPFSLNIKKYEDIIPVLKFIEKIGKVKFEINKHTIIVK